MQPGRPVEIGFLLCQRLGIGPLRRFNAGQDGPADAGLPRPLNDGRPIHVKLG
jgi:hypothetical protein